MTVSETPIPSMRVRTTFRARSIASALLATTPLESSTSSARCIPPCRSRPFRSGTRYEVVSKKVPSARRWRTFTFRGYSAQTEARTSTPMRARRHFRLDMRLRGGRRYVRGAIEVTRLGRCRQRAPSGVRVESELGDERVGSGKALGVAQTRDERNVHTITIEISAGIEEMHLDV